MAPIEQSSVATTPPTSADNCHKVVTKSSEHVPLDARVESTQRRPPRALPGTLLTTHALKASDTPMPLHVLRYLDLVVLLIALPIFIAADLPLLGWAGAAFGWTVQRVVQHAIEKRAQGSDD